MATDFGGTKWNDGSTEMLGFGMDLSEVGIGGTEWKLLVAPIFKIGLDRLLWKSLWVFLVTITCARGASCSPTVPYPILIVLAFLWTQGDFSQSKM